MYDKNLETSSMSGLTQITFSHIPAKVAIFVDELSDFQIPKRLRLHRLSSAEEAYLHCKT